MMTHAEILALTACAGGYGTISIASTKLAAQARPGNFILIQYSTSNTPTPAVILSCKPQANQVDLLYKIDSSATPLLSDAKIGEQLKLSSPLGETLTLNPKRPRPLLIGCELGIAAMIFLAAELRHNKKIYQPVVLLSSETPFPFTAIPSRIITADMPAGVIASLPLMEDWGLTARLASQQGYPGCFDGHSSELARYWLNTLSTEQLNEVEVFICGPTETTDAVAAVVEEFELPFQLSDISKIS